MNRVLKYFIVVVVYNFIYNAGFSQRNQVTIPANQNIQRPADINKISAADSVISKRISYSVKGKDSLRVGFVNVDVFGLQIVSCTNCTVQDTIGNDDEWPKLTVTVKNNGIAMQQKACVWIQYCLKKQGFAGGKFGGTTFEGISMQTESQVIPLLKTGETISLSFSVKFGMGEFNVQKLKYIPKSVNVFLAKNTSSVQRSNAANNNIWCW